MNEMGHKGHKNPKEHKKGKEMKAKRHHAMKHGKEEMIGAFKHMKDHMR